MKRRREPPGGDERAFLEVALPCLDAVTAVARNLTPDAHHAEDLVQETYLRAFAAFDGHRGENPKAWLATICMNVARDQARRRARRVLEASLPDDSEAPSSARDVADEVLAELDRATIAEALGRLPEEQRVAIVLMDLAGHSASEAGAILRCPRNTVLSRVHRGRRRLAQLLALEEVDRGLS